MSETAKSWGWAILHPASGRRDGNYFEEATARTTLAWWCGQYPAERFELVPGTGPTGVPPLRPGNAAEWQTGE